MLAQGSSKTRGPKEGPLKASMSLFSNNSNGDLRKEKTPKMAEMGGRTVDNSGEKTGGNLNREKVKWHLIEVSKECENNMQRSVQFQIQKMWLGKKRHFPTKEKMRKRRGIWH